MTGTRLFAFSTEIASEQNELLTAEALCNICHPEDFETFRVPCASASRSSTLTPLGTGTELCVGVHVLPTLGPDL